MPRIPSARIPIIHTLAHLKWAKSPFWGRVLQPQHITPARNHSLTFTPNMSNALPYNQKLYTAAIAC